MKRWKVAALLCAAFACATLALAGCSSEDYTPPDKDQTVPASALGTDGTLRVGVNAASAPLAGQSQTSSDGRIVGIDVDVAAFMADEMGLKVEVVDVGNDPDAALSDGKVDVVLGVDASDAADAAYWKSEPYLATGVALFGTAAESAIPALDSNPKIAAQSSSKSAWRVTNLYGDDALEAQDDLKSAFDALNSGAVRYVAAEALIGAYAASTNNFDDHIVALLQDPSGYCMAVASSNTDLQSAVAGVVDQLNNRGIMRIIESKWLGSPLRLDDVARVTTDVADSDDSKDDAKSDEADSGESADEPAEEPAEEAAEEPAEE